jgi:hypothetical protein
MSTIRHTPLTQDERQSLDEGLFALQEAIDRVAAQVRKLRDRYAVDIEFFTDNRPRSGVAEVITRDGRTPHLRQLIKEVLRGADNGLSSQEIAEALYIPSPKVSFDLFKRRIIVALSAMNKTIGEVRPVGRGERGREVRWGLVTKTLAATSGEVAANDAGKRNEGEVDIAT